MPQSLSAVYVHLVFSTKDRAPVIVPAWRLALHAYLGGIVRNLGGVPEAVGGVADHVHLLIGLKATHRLSDMLRELKAASSKWVHEVAHDRRFQWQEGYGAFTVGHPHCDDVRRYIEGQEEHHRARSFQEEYFEFLQRGGVEFDERYLW